MQKAKRYDWKDSNLALFGSDTEKGVKKEAAETEKAWRGTRCGEGEATIVFRINKFKVEAWPPSQYGEFFNGDSFIVYHQEKDKASDALKKDIHFWIGKYSTQDEYGTAAYKTVELDTFHDDVPVQHREVQGHESKKFKAYFPSFTILKGGCDSGFRRVLPEQYEPRLFHVQRQSNKAITCTQISNKKGNLNSDDVFIFDLGERIYQYNGSNCSQDEKFKAAQEVQRLKHLRSGKARVDNLEERTTSPTHPAMAFLKDGASKNKADATDKGFKPVMFRISDADGSLDMEDVDGFGRDLLKSDDVFVIDFGDHCYCWVGSGASVDERRNGLAYASNYLNKTAHPWAAITVLAEGKEDEDFFSRF